MATAVQHTKARRPSLPTTILPRIPRSLAASSLSSAQLLRLLAHLRSLYSTTTEPGAASSALDTDDDQYSTTEDEDGDPLGADSQFERSWTKQWIISLLRRASEWVEDAQEGSDERKQRMQVIDEAGQLVASLTETSASGSILRPLSLPTSLAPTPGSDSPPLDLTLNDALPSSLDPTSVGLQSWGSSIILSKMICLEPRAFGVPEKGEQGHRTLELGAGTGLLSLVWKGMSERLGAKGGEVVATDFHEDVLANLRHNVNLNTPTITPSASPHASPPFLAADSRSRRSSSSGFPSASLSALSSARPAPPISAHHLDWSAVHSSRQFANAFPSSAPSTPLGSPDPYQAPNPATALPEQTHPTMPPPFDRPFHTLLAADVVYGPEHALWLKSCVEQFLIRPSSSFAGPNPPTSFNGASIVQPAPLDLTALESLDLNAPSRPVSPSAPTPAGIATPPAVERPMPAFHLIVPLRPTHTAAIASIAQVFPQASDLPPREEREGKAWKVAVRRQRELGRERGVGRADEGGYRLFEIGWC